MNTNEGPQDEFTEKRCNRCGETKPLDAFSRKAASKDGLYPSCRACANEVSKAWRKANRERAAETNRAWRKANRERAAETNRAWRKANRERAAETKRAWYEANPTRTRERVWRGNYRVSARKNGIEPVIATGDEDVTVAGLVARWGDRCWHCGDPEWSTLDHHPVPTALGGDHSLTNTRPSCWECNASQGGQLATRANGGVLTPSGEASRRWRAANPEAYREHLWRSHYRRSARKYGLEPVVPMEGPERVTVQGIITLYGDRCWHCAQRGDEGPFEQLDHYPIATRDGGEHSLSNVVPACARCNTSLGRHKPTHTTEEIA